MIYLLTDVLTDHWLTSSYK